MTETHRGHCLCTAVQFQVEGAPLWVAHCHCASCRRATGAPITTYIGFRADQVTFDPDTRCMHASSPGVQRGFCGRCGSALSYQSSRWPGEIHVHISAMEHPEHFLPTAHVYHGERIAWLELNDALPRYGGPGGAGRKPESHGPLAGDDSDC